MELLADQLSMSRLTFYFIEDSLDLKFYTHCVRAGGVAVGLSQGKVLLTTANRSWKSIFGNKRRLYRHKQCSFHDIFYIFKKTKIHFHKIHIPLENLYEI